jgi:hypothetical protein
MTFDWFFQILKERDPEMDALNADHARAEREKTIARLRLHVLEDRLSAAKYLSECQTTEQKLKALADDGFYA